MIYDLKCNCLEKITNVKGLSFHMLLQGTAAPAAMNPAFKLGLDLVNDKARFNLKYNFFNSTMDSTLVYKLCSRANIGWEWEVNMKERNFPKYTFGLSWEPADKALFMLKHESIEKETDLKIGKLFFMFFHQASSKHTLGSEFMLDWQKKAMEARFGLTHKFDDNATGKIKFNHAGQIDAALKYKFSEAVTASVTTGMQVRDVPAAKGKTLPVGFGLNLVF